MDGGGRLLNGSWQESHALLGKLGIMQGEQTSSGNGERERAWLSPIAERTRNHTAHVNIYSQAKCQPASTNSPTPAPRAPFVWQGSTDIRHTGSTK